MTHSQLRGPGWPRPGGPLRVRVYEVDYRPDGGRLDPRHCHVVAGSWREARAIAAVMHPDALILWARRAERWAAAGM